MYRLLPKTINKNMQKIDFSIENTGIPKKGKILLSEPFLKDEFFTRSVILLCEHNQSGSFGFVLNNYVEVNLKEIDACLTNNNTKISLGGPVKPQNLFFIHTLGEKIDGCYPISDGLYIGGNHQQIFEAIKCNSKNKSQIRFFLGYSGWDDGQLQMELNENSWVVVDDIDVGQIMSTDNNEMWKEIMESQGEKYKMMSQFPLDPRLN